jgi:dienelactone hydrolase
MLRNAMLCAALIAAATCLSAGQVMRPETVEFPNGSLKLKGLVFRPTLPGRRPIVVYLHGIGNEYGPEIDAVAEAYTAHGYVLFAPFRRGQGLSAAQGSSMRDRLLREEKEHGEASARRLQAQLLDTEQIDDVRAAVEYARTLSGVRTDRITVAGNSFGGALAVVAAARLAGLRAVVASAPAAQAWAKSPEIRTLLLNAAHNARVPVFLFQAANDFDTDPSAKLAEELSRSSKICVRKMYPAFGKTKMDGHHIGYFGAKVWADDVFRFLKSNGAD